MFYGILLLAGIVTTLVLVTFVMPDWRQFRLWQLLAMVALAACLVALIRLALQAAYFAAAQAAYGGQRFTREEAESICGSDVDLLPDSEFLPARQAATERGMDRAR